jgi:predicted polyphosphate/ATP-dependent NAD kinase
VSLVGIIANPSSGKDIRRLVAHGSTFDNNEKINIVRRALIGLEAAGVDRVAYLPDTYAIVARAAAPLDLRLEISPLPMVALDNAGDSLEAARRLADRGAGAIVTLGGDGTNRIVAKGCDDVPLVAVSTGTNNVFPRMVEGTLAGLAAGLVATGAVGTAPSQPPIVRRFPRLDVSVEGEVRDLALIDVVTCRRSWVGARALWDPAQLGEVVLSRVVPAAIGMASLGSLLFPAAGDGCAGVHVVVGAGDTPSQVLAPLAPGLMRRVPIRRAELFGQGESVSLQREPCTIALDGEREFEIMPPGAALQVTLNPRGPRLVDIEAALRAGAEIGYFDSDALATVGNAAG